MDPVLLSRLDQMEAEYRDLLSQLATPEVASDHQRYTEVAKRVAELEEAVRAYESYKKAVQESSDGRELLGATSAGDEQDFYRAEIESSDAKLAELEGTLGELLRPRDPRDDRNVIVEIRAGAGGDEAALFAGDLLRMYQRFAERQGWKTEVLDASDSGVGGVKEVVFEIKGKGAFSKLRYESGVHRVQRVPVTESSGRIHTSTSTVAVLAAADEVDVEINPEELRIDYFRASGPGGQHVNTTDSAVRLTHLPSGIVVSCQSERSQRQNRDRAMRILLAKLQALAEDQAKSELAQERKSQVGTGDRAEKIRTYNFQQNRITDHRIGFTMHGIEQVLDGDIEDIVDALARHGETLPDDNGD